MYKAEDFERANYGTKNIGLSYKPITETVIICCSEFEEKGSVFDSMYHNLANTITKYTNILTQINDELIISGKTHEAILAYLSLFECVADRIAMIGEQHHSLCLSFIDEIDKTDQLVYKKGTDIRDYSNEKLSYLARWVDDTHGAVFTRLDNFINNAFEFVGHLIYKFGDGINKLLGHVFGESKDNSEMELAVALDYKNFEIKDLHDIFHAIWEIDNHYADLFGQLYDEMIKINKVLKEAAEIISSGSIKIDNIKELIKEVDEIYIPDFSNSFIPEKLNSDVIDQFCSDDNNRSFFTQYTPALNDAIYSVGVIDTVTMLVFQGKNIASTQLFENYKMPEVVDSNDAYQYLLIKRDYAEMIEQLATRKKTDEEQLLNDDKELIEKLKKCLDKFSKGEDMEFEDEYKQVLSELFTFASALGDKLGIAVDVIDIVLPLFKKYTSEVEIIDSLMAGVDENSLSGIALQEMREEYNNNFILSAKKMYEVVVDKCISEGKKVGKEVLNLISENSLGLYKAVDMAIAVTGKLTGLSTASSAQLEFLCLNSNSAQLDAAFSKNFEIVANGDHSEEAITNLNNSFEVLRNNYAKQFSLLADEAGVKGKHDLKRYYRYLEKQIKNAEITNLKESVAISFDEYLAST